MYFWHCGLVSFAKFAFERATVVVVVNKLEYWMSFVDNTMYLPYRNEPAEISEI